MHAAALALLALGVHASPFDASQPLDLTELLSSGMDIADVRAAANVKFDEAVIPAEQQAESYSGFFQVNETSGLGNTFFWYFPAQDGNTSAPLLIWLQGGPGGSSLFGLFAENGPYVVNSDLKTLSRRNETWGEHYGLIYIDNPFGAGFSNTEDGYVSNEDEVGENLLSFLRSFYTVFPDTKPNDLYITGESYAGHYIPALAFAIVNSPSDNINLAGVAIGDGWVDPVNMIPQYPQLMFQLGLADGQELAQIQSYCDKTVELIKMNEYEAAFRVWDEMLNGDLYPYANYFANITGLHDYYNFLRDDSPPEQDYFASFVTLNSTRQAIHVGDTPFGTNARDCEMHLVSDFHQSMAPRVETLLNKGIKVLIYVGQLDIIIGAPLVEAYIPLLNWAGQSEYKAAPRNLWRLTEKGRVAGYVRKASNLLQVSVRAAGHILPFDQPEVAKAMITNFVEDYDF